MSKSFGQKVGNTADVIVGDIILGSIGRAGYHVGKIPGVAKAGAYVKENISDGYHAAELAEKKRKALASLQRITREGVAMSPATLRQIAEQNGLDSKALDGLMEMARKAAGKGAEIPHPGDGTYHAPAAAGA